MNEVITTAIIGSISTIVGYIVGNRKSRAEVNALEIENVKEVISVYTMAINDLKVEIKELKEQIEKYQSHIEKLQTELYTLRSQINPDVRPAL
jgi:predicted RNase H-like nuclease (RuvC/YqgF family)